MQQIYLAMGSRSALIIILVLILAGETLFYILKTCQVAGRTCLGTVYLVGIHESIFRT